MKTLREKLESLIGKEISYTYGIDGGWGSGTLKEVGQDYAVVETENEEHILNFSSMLLFKIIHD